VFGKEDFGREGMGGKGRFFENSLLFDNPKKRKG